MGALNALGIITASPACTAATRTRSTGLTSSAPLVGPAGHHRPQHPDQRRDELNEDVIVVLDTQEMHLWEDGDGAPQLSFEQTARQQPDHDARRLQLHRLHRGPVPGGGGKVGGLDTVGGNGLVAPTF
jgi:hypothetical protein